MNRFVKKHYHLISFVILLIIFVVWGVLQSHIFPETSLDASTESGSQTESIALSSSVDLQEVTPEDTTDPFAVSRESAANDMPNETEKASDAGESEDITPASDDIWADFEVNVYEPVETDPESALPPESEDATEVGVPEAAKEEVILEEGTYGPGEGKMPFDLCLANVRESLNVRSGPGEENEIIAKFLPVDYARVLERGTEWSLITSGEITGYAHNDYLITGDKALKKLVDSDKLCVTVTKKLINIRAEKSTDAEVLRQATMDETFKCIPSDSDSEWFAIKYDDGNTAYVATTLAHVTAEMDTIDSLTPVG